MKLELKRAYNLFDKNLDGTLTPDEIKQLVEKVSLNLSNKEVDELISSLDKNSDGSVTFEGFLFLLLKITLNRKILFLVSIIVNFN